MKTHPEMETLKSLVGLHADRPDAAAALLDESGLADGDFTVPALRALFVALSANIREKQPLDVVSLLHATARATKREAVLEAVTGDNPNLAAERIKVLRSETQRRQMLEHLEGLTKLVKEPGAIDAAFGEVERVLRGLSANGPSRATPLRDSVGSFIDRLEAVQKGTRVATIPTGIEILDYAIGGMQPTLTMVGALPGIGKSALFAAIAQNLAARGLKVGVLSLEDDREWLTERIFADSSRVPLFVLGNKPLTNTQMGHIQDCADGVSAVLANIITDDTPAMTAQQVVASARSMVARGCRAILVDHLGEIRLERSERHDLDIQEALQDLRGIAKTYRVPVWVACHLKRREGLDVHAVPRLSDFAFSAAVERCARVALGLFRPKPEDAKRSSVPLLGVEVMKQTKGPKDFHFMLNVGQLYGVVAPTPVSRSMREEFGSWRDS